MSYLIRPISNGITISAPTGENGDRQEHAFLFNTETWKEDAEQHVDNIKQVIVDKMAAEAKQRIQQIADAKENGTLNPID